MANPVISASVGRSGKNIPADVVTIQKLLNEITRSSLIVSGICDEETIKGIENFQKTFLSAPDGRIDVGGKTFDHLLSRRNSAFVPLPQPTDRPHYSISPAERQFGTPKTIDTILSVASAYSLVNPGLAIGVGDISFKDGRTMPPHASHIRGIDADFRPLRKDGKRLPVTIHDPDYSRESTALLISQFLANSNVKRILFNDGSIPGVTAFAGHDNHFHVTMKQ